MPENIDCPSCDDLPGTPVPGQEDVYAFAMPMPPDDQLTPWQAMQPAAKPHAAWGTHLAAQGTIPAAHLQWPEGLFDYDAAPEPGPVAGAQPRVEYLPPLDAPVHQWPVQRQVMQRHPVASIVHGPHDPSATYLPPLGAPWAEQAGFDPTIYEWERELLRFAEDERRSGIRLRRGQGSGEWHDDTAWVRERDYPFIGVKDEPPIFVADDEERRSAVDELPKRGCAWGPVIIQEHLRIEHESQRTFIFTGVFPGEKTFDELTDADLDAMRDQVELFAALYYNRLLAEKFSARSIDTSGNVYDGTLDVGLSSDDLNGVVKDKFHSLYTDSCANPCVLRVSPLGFTMISPPVVDDTTFAIIGLTGPRALDGQSTRAHYEVVVLATVRFNLWVRAAVECHPSGGPTHAF